MDTKRKARRRSLRILSNPVPTTYDKTTVSDCGDETYGSLWLKENPCEAKSPTTRVQLVEADGGGGGAQPSTASLDHLCHHEESGHHDESQDSHARASGQYVFCSETSREKQHQDNLPRAQDNLPRAQDNLPRAQDNLPRAQDNLLRAQDNLPRAQDNLPRAQGNLPRAHLGSGGHFETFSSSSGEPSLSTASVTDYKPEDSVSPLLCSGARSQPVLNVLSTQNEEAFRSSISNSAFDSRINPSVYKFSATNCVSPTRSPTSASGSVTLSMRNSFDDHDQLFVSDTTRQELDENKESSKNGSDESGTTGANDELSDLNRSQNSQCMTGIDEESYDNDHTSSNYLHLQHTVYTSPKESPMTQLHETENCTPTNGLGDIELSGEFPGTRPVSEFPAETSELQQNVIRSPSQFTTVETKRTAELPSSRKSMAAKAKKHRRRSAFGAEFGLGNRGLSDVSTSYLPMWSSTGSKLEASVNLPNLSSIGGKLEANADLPNLSSIWGKLEANTDLPNSSSIGSRLEANTDLPNLSSVGCKLEKSTDLPNLSSIGCKLEKSTDLPNLSSIGCTLEKSTDLPNLSSIGCTLEKNTDLPNVSSIGCTLEKSTDLPNMSSIGCTLEKNTDLSNLSSIAYKLEKSTDLPILSSIGCKLEENTDLTNLSSTGSQLEAKALPAQEHVESCISYSGQSALEEVQPSKTKCNKEKSDSCVSMSCDVTNAISEDLVEADPPVEPLSGTRSSRRRRSSLRLYRQQPKPGTVSTVSREHSDCSATGQDTKNTDLEMQKSSVQSGCAENESSDTTDSLDLEVEQLYRNNNYKKPTDKTWETIFEAPSKGKATSKLKLKRFIHFTDNVPIHKLKRRMKKAACNGWNGSGSTINQKYCDSDLKTRLEQLDVQMSN